MKGALHENLSYIKQLMKKCRIKYTQKEEIKSHYNIFKV